MSQETNISPMRRRPSWNWKSKRARKYIKTNLGWTIVLASAFLIDITWVSNVVALMLQLVMAFSILNALLGIFILTGRLDNNQSPKVSTMVQEFLNDLPRTVLPPKLVEIVFDAAILVALVYFGWYITAIIYFTDSICGQMVYNAMDIYWEKEQLNYICNLGQEQEDADKA